MTQAPKYGTPWRTPESVPDPFGSPDFVLEPLHERHAELDYLAVSSCRDRLRRELQWGDWPADDFDLAFNRRDLRAHHGEFRRGEAFAYTVLSPDGERCLGCIYIERCPEVDGAQLALWVVDDALDMETDLATNVLAWLHGEWNVERVLLPFGTANTRGIEIAVDLGLSAFDVSEGALAEHRCFVSEP